MAEFLLELLGEEIPARMQRDAAENLEKLFVTGLASANLSHETVEAHVTPRRMALHVTGLPVVQPDMVEERKGPKVGSPEGALHGFLKRAGLDSLDQAEQRDTGKGLFWFAVNKRMGRPVPDILAETVGSILTQFPWPKSMRWSAHRLTWVRPLHNILMVLDGVPIPQVLEFGPTLSFTGNHRSTGHRFLAPGWFEVTAFAQYKAALRERFVILDRAERRAEIERQLTEAAAAKGLKIVADAGLLEEVTGLVEWPTVLLGRIDDDYMDLPPEVRQVTMRENQRYFTLANPDGSPAPWFAMVANVPGTADGGQTIIGGNERVLRARLSDARFFWDQDLKVKLEDRLPALEAITFHAKLGTVRQKAERIAKLAKQMARYINLPSTKFNSAQAENAFTAGRLAKADLVTGMVGEFPELQGLMGGYYARVEGLDNEIASAIADHYKPAGPSDHCPSEPVAVAVAMADKLDSLIGFFMIDETPTGSRDPYALRRAAIGIIRLIRENEIRHFPLDGHIETAAENYLDQDAHGAERISDDGKIPDYDKAVYRSALRAFDFIIDRLKVFLKDEGFRPDYVDASLRIGGCNLQPKHIDMSVIENDYDLLRIVRRAEALQAFLSSSEGESLLAAYNRAKKIVQEETAKDGTNYRNETIDQANFKEREETDLWEKLEAAVGPVKDLTRREAFADCMTLLATLRQPIDAFFDKVLVNHPNPALRGNRLSMLEKFVSTVNTIADFSRITDY